MRFVILSLLALSICSCKNDPKATIFDNPESVVRAYYDALSELDFTKAAQYCTKESGQLIEVLGYYINKLGPDTLQSMKSKMKKDYKHIPTVTCTDKTSSIKICDLCCDSVGQPLDGPTTLKRENGKWLVSSTKEARIDSIREAKKDNK